MRLQFFESPNFGDALNPYLFHHLLPGFFDNDPAIDFFGIGSILGFPMVTDAQKKVVFSSGFAYGTKPVVDDSYDIFCVRGPLTAKALNLSPSVAIADGAILIKTMPLEKVTKKFDFSFMPHWESELKFNWKKLCEDHGIHYISPMQETTATLRDILQSRVVIAEAMHAAIVADALRVPWIPVKGYAGINDFKWNDWSLSLGLPDYSPHVIPSLFNNTEFVRDLCQKKISKALPSFVYGAGIQLYQPYQALAVKPGVGKLIEKIKKERQFLSDDARLNERIDQLTERLDLVKQKYGKR